MQSISMIHGVDVAKDELFIQCADQTALVRLGNNAGEIRCWLRQLPKGSVVAMESTGKYHQLLARLAHAAGMQVYVLNARRLYFYARGLEVRAKTDRVDAGVIARYVAEHRHKLHPWQPASEQHRRLDELIRRRAVAVVKRESIRQSLGDCKDLKAEFRKLDRALQAFVHSVDRKIDELLRADDQLRSARALIDSVIGFGPVGSAALAVLLERLPFASSDALVAYSGCDPRPDDSGRKRGKRKLTKAGPGYLRKQWFMVGFSAARAKALKPMYQALLARGLATTEATIILGRKLLRAAYGVWKTKSPFDLQLFLHH
ncbi:MAG: IS110 family transposase [Comamonadaceae bacterium]|nr:MAG: IS110 family transposase [Comamonadaceae bacterium]